MLYPWSVSVSIIGSKPYLTIREEASPLIIYCNSLIFMFTMPYSTKSVNATATLTLESCYAYLHQGSGVDRDADAMIRMAALAAEQMHDRCAYARWMPSIYAPDLRLFGSFAQVLLRPNDM